MDSFWDAMAAIVAVPTWLLVFTGVISVIASFAAFLVVDWLAYKLAWLHFSGAKESQHDERWDVNRKSTKVTNKTAKIADSSTSTGTLDTLIVDDVPRSTLSTTQKQELDHRIRIGGGFSAADAVTILGMTVDTLRRLVACGKLSGYTDQFGKPWITAKSISEYLSQGVSPVKPAPVWSASESDPQTTKQQTKRIPPLRQHYWYYIDNKPDRYATLAIALSVMSYNGRASEWVKLPSDIQSRIRREKL